MKKFAFLICAAGLLLISAVNILPAAGGMDDASKEEMKKLEGTWVMISHVHDGKEKPAEEVKKHTLIIKGEQWTLKNGDKVIIEGTHKVVDHTQKPKHHEAKHTAGLGAGSTFLTIYELEGDTLRYSRTGTGKERPKDFTSKPGSDQLVVTYKRQP